MEHKRRILILLEVMQENVKHHKWDKNNTKEFELFYDGYETAIKEIKKKIKEMDELEDGWWNLY